MLFSGREVDDGADAKVFGINAWIQIQNFIDPFGVAQFVCGDGEKRVAFLNLVLERLVMRIGAVFARMADRADLHDLLAFAEAEGKRLMRFVSASVIREDFCVERDGADDLLRMRAVVIGLDDVVAFFRIADHKLFGAIALREVRRIAAARGGEAVVVHALFFEGIGHPQVHVRHVRVPIDDDADIDVDQMAEFRGNLLDGDVLPFRAFGDTVDFVQRDVFDFWEAAVELVVDDDEQQVNGFLILAEFVENERKIAIGLRLLFRHGENLAEDLLGGFEFAEETELVAENAEDLAVFEFEFRKIGEDGDGRELVFQFRREEVRAVHEETGGVSICLAEREIRLVCFVFIRLAEIVQIWRGGRTTTQDGGQTLRHYGW